MIDDLDDYAQHFAGRVLADAITAANREQLLKRADDFDAAKPRPGDFTGQADPQTLREIWQRCEQKARALRSAATLGTATGGVADTLPAILCPVCLTPTSPWTCSCGETEIRVGRGAA